MENIVQADYKTVLDTNGVLAFVPGGISMWPTLKNRRQSVIVQKKEGRLSEYDVALYIRKNGSYVLHRVMQVTDNGYVMCGDSQFTLEPVLEEQVIGVMIGFYRGKRYIECTNEDYKKEVQAWYGNQRRRKRKLSCFYRFQWLKNLPKRAWRKLIKGKNKNV